MEFNFFINSAIPLDENGFGLINCADLSKNSYSLSQFNNYKPTVNQKSTKDSKLTIILDQMGEKSSIVILNNKIKFFIKF